MNLLDNIKKGINSGYLYRGGNLSLYWRGSYCLLEIDWIASVDRTYTLQFWCPGSKFHPFKVFNYLVYRSEDYR